MVGGPALASLGHFNIMSLVMKSVYGNYEQLGEVSFLFASLSKLSDSVFAFYLG